MSKKPNTELVQSIDRLSATDANAVGVAINAMVQRDYVRNHLQNRHLLGVLARHSGKNVDLSVRNLTKAQQAHRNWELGVFALRGYQHQVIGMATIDPAPRLKRQRMQLPPLLAAGPLAYDIVVPGPQIGAWVAPGEGKEGGEVLADAYALLADPEGPAWKFYEQYVSSVPADVLPRAWAIEPQQSPDWVKQSIRSAGYNRIDVGYYDDGASHRAAPPIAGLYVHQATAY